VNASYPRDVKYRYLVAVTQQGRISHVNGAWIGAVEPTEPNAIDTCPELYDYLDQMGDQGWRLVTSTPLGNQGQVSNLFLERAEA